MKKRVVFMVGTLILLICFAITSYAQPSSKYDQFKQSFDSTQITPGPNGESAKTVIAKYQGNKDKDPKMFKKENDIKGYVSEDEITKKGGKYTIKEIMSYKDFYDLGIDEGFRHDIDPDRMLWVFAANFDIHQNIMGISVSNARVTSVYDAETGDLLMLNVKSDDPNWINHINKTKP
jgi:hypothetical protein